MLRRLTRIGPLASLPNPREVWSWISFDVANQSFTLVINTLLFSIFFQKVIVRDPAIDDRAWSLLFAGSMLLVVLASPVAGAIADGKGTKKRWLIGTGVACAVATCGLAILPTGTIWLAVLLYVPANFCFNIGENFLAAFLPRLAPREKMGALSGFSWACAYAAALLILGLVAGAMLLLDLKRPEQWRPFFVGAGVWFLLFLIPTLVFLREDPSPQRTGRGAVAEGFARLRTTVREAKKFRDLGVLLAASFFYGAGMATVIAFASILAEEFGFREDKLVIFTGVITVTGIIGTIAPTLLQDRLGHKRTTLILLLLWVATTLYLAWVARTHARASPGATPPSWPIWLAGNLIGLGLGSLGSANRAFFAFLTPADRSAEFFGLWGLVFKLAAVLVIPFGYAKDKVGTPAALLVLAGFFVIGLALTCLLDERRGAEAARSA